MLDSVGTWIAVNKINSLFYSPLLTNSMISMRTEFLVGTPLRTEPLPASKLLGGFKLRGFFENLQQLLGTIHTVTFCAADFSDDTLLLQLTNGAHYGVVS